MSFGALLRQRRQERDACVRQRAERDLSSSEPHQGFNAMLRQRRQEQFHATSGLSRQVLSSGLSNQADRPEAEDADELVRQKGAFGAANKSREEEPRANAEPDGAAMADEAAGLKVKESAGLKADEAAGSKVEEAAGLKVEDAAGLKVVEAAGLKADEAAGLNAEAANSKHVHPTVTVDVSAECYRPEEQNEAPHTQEQCKHQDTHMPNSGNKENPQEDLAAAVKANNNAASDGGSEGGSKGGSLRDRMARRRAERGTDKNQWRAKLAEDDKHRQVVWAEEEKIRAQSQTAENLERGQEQEQRRKVAALLQDWWSQ